MNGGGSIILNGSAAADSSFVTGTELFVTGGMGQS